MNNGYIKLHRSLLDNPYIMNDPNRLAVWIYLLLNATHKECKSVFGGKPITLKAGQLVTGRKVIASMTHVSESKVFRTLKEFESEQQIELQTSTQNTLITIVNWELYQCCEQPFEQQMNNERTTNEQQMNNERTTSEHIQECNNVKNDKNVKNERKNKKADEPLIIPDTLSESVKACVSYFIDYRRNDKKKPMTQRAVDMLAKQLLDMPDDATRINSIEHSIACGYQGVFEYSTKSKPQPKASNSSTINSLLEKIGGANNVIDGRYSEDIDDDSDLFS